MYRPEKSREGLHLLIDFFLLRHTLRDDRLRLVQFFQDRVCVGIRMRKLFDKHVSDSPNVGEMTPDVI